MENDYNNLIYFAICDKLYDEMLKTNYSSFDNFCKNLKYSIIGGGNITGEQYKIIANLIRVISGYYEIDKDYVGTYIREFFDREIYLIYGKTIMVIKTNVNNYKQQKK